MHPHVYTGYIGCIQVYWTQRSVDLSDYQPAGHGKTMWGTMRAKVLAGAGSIRPPSAQLMAEQHGMLSYEVFFLGLHLRHRQAPEHLCLANCRLGDDGLRVLSAALLKNTTVQALELQGNGIGDEGIVQLAELLAHRPVRELDLRNNPFASSNRDPSVAEQRLAEEVWQLDVLNGLSALDIPCETREGAHTLLIKSRELYSYEVIFLTQQLAHPSASTHRLLLQDLPLPDRYVRALLGGLVTHAQGGLGDGGSLKVLSLRYTKKLETLPSSISGLISLETLDLGGSAISVLPKSLGELCALRELNLEECYNLQELTPGLREKLEAQGCHIIT